MPDDAWGQAHHSTDFRTPAAGQQPTMKRAAAVSIVVSVAHVRHRPPTSVQTHRTLT